ncbi:MAG: glutathione peroxidase [Lishizhenia sp.]
MSLHNFKVKDITGKVFDFSKLKGKKVLLVNTASECGLTPQYTQLEELYNLKQNNNFVIVGFPANNFGAQEPGSDNDIALFCEKNYGVSFPMMSKISVKGSDIHPLYKWLLEESSKIGQHTEVQWNFHKFLMNEEGMLVESIAPTVEPLDTQILNWIEDE